MGGFYYVHDGERVHECRACGRFRKENITPLVGDYVRFSGQDGLLTGYIEDIEPRGNSLVRPAVSNVDAMLLVVSAQKPHIDFMLADKLIMQAGLAGIEPVVCVNKSEAGAETAEEVVRQYAAFKTLVVSAHTRAGMEGLKDILRGRCVCFAGQSAVGKSSLINVVDGTLELPVGGLSKKTDRGKHTTRSVELIYIAALDAYVFDTPGFSMFDIGDMEKEDVRNYYREFEPYVGECKFSVCLHGSEPGCAVKRAVEAGEINEQRYERYLKITNAIGEKK